MTFELGVYSSFVVVDGEPKIQFGGVESVVVLEVVAEQGTSRSTNLDRR